MARYAGTTAERGLGTAHQADRERLLALHHDGDPCWRCGQPMYKAQGLDRDHIVDRALGGTDGPAALAHSSCNRSAGATLGNQLQPRLIITAVAGHDTICKTCGQTYHRAARWCQVCKAHYHPNRADQRTCGRICGVQLRRRLYGPTGRKAAQPKPPCEVCGQPCRTGSGRYCSRACVTAAAEARQVSATAIEYYRCRYCDQLGVTRANARQKRKVCPGRHCQLARLQANRLRTRNGWTREDADSYVATIVRSTLRD